MKKALLLLIIVLSAILPTYASHLMGGQITARQLSGLSYEVTLTVYRDIVGIDVDTITDFRYDNVSTGTFYAVRSVHVSPVNRMANNVEEYAYKDTITFPVDGQYKVSYSSCCRNAAISNMYDPGSQSIYLYTTFTVGAGLINSTPVLLNLPVTLAAVMQPWSYNPLPYDADGDSLSWVLDVPMTDTLTPCSAYGLPAADSSGPFIISAYTGEIDWTPWMSGNWNATVLVREFRNGVQIGEIRRDMQILTIDNSSNRLAFSGTPQLQTNAQGFYEYIIPAGAPFHLVINADNNDGDSVYIEAAGATFKNTANPSVATIFGAHGHSQVAFDWTPAAADVSGKPYIDVFRGFEHHYGYVFINDLTIGITVAAVPNGLTHLSNTQTLISTYPNPGHNHLIVEVNTTQESTSSIHLCDLSGRVVATVIDGRIHTGKTAISMEIQHLPIGIYILSGMCNGEKVNSKVVVE
ncbi:MAG: hypothetical protein JWO03_633 [Bacteroidetes bacterium]|nr:hypothetical protein [Bacteroidota bacterium]